MLTKKSSDLAVENFGFAAPLHSDTVTEAVRYGFLVIRASLTDGEYHTIVSGRIWHSDVSLRRKLSSLTADILREMIGNPQRILFCGIGNSEIPSDALGAKVAAHLIVTGETPPAGKPSVFAIRPGIIAQTGIDTSVYLRCVADEIKPDLIIIADSLAARTRERLQTVIQISDSGLTPGSALARTSGEISSHTMPCPVISIGVPTVISTAALSDKAEDEPLLVTRADSDIVTDCYASIISSALNSAIFGK